MGIRSQRVLTRERAVFVTEMAIGLSTMTICVTYSQMLLCKFGSHLARLLESLFL